MPPRRRMTEEELAASKARANAKRRLRRLWDGDSSEEEIREELGITEEQFRALVVELGLGERRGVYEPSQETIRLICARFRMSWTQSERESRLGGGRADRME